MRKRILTAVCGALCAAAVSASASAAQLGEVHAKSAILMTDTGQVLFEHNADAVHPPASVTKLMTMLLTIEAVDSGSASLDDWVTASAHAAEMGGSQIYLKEGERMTLDDMLKSIAVASANDAAVAVAEHLGGSEAHFVSMMNERAKQLGCKRTEFVNPNGLDTDGEQTKTTARDLALISQQLLQHPKILNYPSIWMDSVRNGSFGLANTNKMLKLYDGMVGLKTGYTSTAGYCISAAAQRDGMCLLAVVLGEPDKQSRNQDITAMLNYGFAEYTVVPIADGETLPEVAVELGTRGSVPVKLAEETPLLLKKTEAGSIRREIVCAQRTRAPVQAGDKLGEIIVTGSGGELARRALVAADSADKKQVPDIFRELLEYLLMKKSLLTAHFLTSM